MGTRGQGIEAERLLRELQTAKAERKRSLPFTAAFGYDPFGLGAFTGTFALIGLPGLLNSFEGRAAPVEARNEE